MMSVFNIQLILEISIELFVNAELLSWLRKEYDVGFTSNPLLLDPDYSTS
jgi:hypothetical protein